LPLGLQLIEVLSWGNKYLLSFACLKSVNYVGAFLFYYA